MLAQRPIVLASGNSGKIKEIQALLTTRQIIPQSVFNVIECEETGATFLENAILKARNACLQSDLPAIADDSGLIVDALQDAPGVKSARYAGQNATDQENINKLLTELALVPDEQRDARFVCIMVFMKHADDPCPLIAQGSWQGKILKNVLSHRGQALKQLTTLLNANDF